MLNRTKRRPLRLIVLLVAMHVVMGGLTLLGALQGCGGDDPEGQTDSEALLVHVGGTMTPAMTEIAELYESETGQDIEINTGGSGELLAFIESHKQGDFYVSHDPFLKILMEKFQMGVDAWTIAEIRPVIIVDKNSDKIDEIRTVADLAKDDVQIALTATTHSTLGWLLPKIMEKAGVDYEKLKESPNLTVFKKGGQVANAVKSGNADAGMVWDAVAHLRREDVKIIPLADEALPTPGVDVVTTATQRTYSLMPVKVTMATLTCSEQPAAARKFAEFVTTDAAQEILRNYGFTLTTPRMEFRNGQPVENE